MLVRATQLKNIPISLSLLYDKEYNAQTILMMSAKKARRCFSENNARYKKNKQSLYAITELADLPNASTQMYHQALDV
jgi:hypothetical protein